MHGAEWSQEQGDLQLNLDQAYRDGVSKDFTDRYIPIIVPTATSEYAGAMSAADKQKLDSLSNSSDVYVVDYITDDSGTITQEQYNEIKAAIEENKVIIFTIDTLQQVVTRSFLKDSSLKLYFSLNDITQRSNALQVNALILHINSNGEYYTESPHINLYNNGDGTRFLSDNGTYKTIEIPDLSNYLTEDDKTELETEIGDLSENVNGQITELQKKDSTIEGNVTNLTETVSTINDTVSGLDGKYLPLTGGTLQPTYGQFILDLKPGQNYSSDGYLSITGDDIIHTRENDLNEHAGTLISFGQNFSDISKTNCFSIGVPGINGINSGYSKTIFADDSIYFSPVGPSIHDHRYYKIYHEDNVVGSKVTTNDVSGGLNITSITQSAYDGLDSKDANTLYIITE